VADEAIRKGLRLLNSLPADVGWGDYWKTLSDERLASMHRVLMQEIHNRETSCDRLGTQEDVDFLSYGQYQLPCPECIELAADVEADDLASESLCNNDKCSFGLVFSEKPVYDYADEIRSRGGEFVEFQWAQYDEDRDKTLKHLLQLLGGNVFYDSTTRLGLIVYVPPLLRASSEKSGIVEKANGSTS